MWNYDLFCVACFLSRPEDPLPCTVWCFPYGNIHDAADQLIIKPLMKWARCVEEKKKLKLCKAGGSQTWGCDPLCSVRIVTQ